MLKFLQHQVNLYIDTQPAVAKFPTCSYLEGISEAAEAVQDVDLSLYKKIIERMEIQIEVPRLLQKKKFFENNDKTKKYAGLFVAKPEEHKARNDVTQHCLISMLKANKVLKEFK